MNDWLMVGVWRHILRLPPAIGRRRAGALAARARSEVGAVSPEHRAVHRFVVRELPRHGKPIPPQVIAEGLRFPVEEVVEILSDLERRKGFLFRSEDGSVLWAYPVTAEPTPHRIRFTSGETLYAA